MELGGQWGKHSGKYDHFFLKRLWGDVHCIAIDAIFNSLEKKRTEERCGIFFQEMST